MRKSEKLFSRTAAHTGTPNITAHMSSCKPSTGHSVLELLESRALDRATMSLANWPESCVAAATTIVITISIRSVAILSCCYFLGGEGQDSEFC